MRTPSVLTACLFTLLACVPAPPVGTPPATPTPSVQPSASPTVAATAAPTCQTPRDVARTSLTVTLIGPNSQALDGAQARIFSQDPCAPAEQTQISQAGQVVFEDLPVGVPLLLTATAPDLHSEITPVTLNDSTHALTLSLVSDFPNPGPTFASTPDPLTRADLSGRVTDLNGQPVSAALVSVAYQATPSNPFYYVMSQADGRFQIESLLKAEALLVSVYLPGQATPLQQVITLQSDVSQNTLRFQSGVPLNPSATPWPRPEPTATPGIF